MPIPVKQAVGAALAFLSEINQGRPSLEDVAVEEVELSDDTTRWKITLGFYPAGSSVQRFTGQKIQREYRIFEVDAAMGSVVSMKIRKP